MHEKSGVKINEQTADEDLLQHIEEGHLASNAEKGVKSDFEPLAPPVIQKKENAFPEMSPGDIANAVRVLSKD